ncbi:MAG: SGNH/GDSL hydrolase family protein [Lentisphaerae bacterium]|jgi:lysophospholipase L1-like esterase|nr:SGNH/GDSL hydrolase family protein [Lentisphaerota bacterium]
MNRRIMFLFGVWLAGGAVLAANLLKNPGFEKGNTLFDTQKYWAGTVEHIQDAAKARTGKGVIRLVSAPGRGTVFGRLLLRGRQSEPSGKIYVFSLWARGTGALHLGGIRYITPPEGKPPYEFDWQEEGVTLTDTWQQVSYTIDLSRRVANFLAMVVELRGEGEAYLDDVSLETVVQPGAFVTAQTRHLVQPAGKAEDLVLTTQPQAPVFVSVAKGKDAPVCHEVTSNAEGKVFVPGAWFVSAEPVDCRIAACSGGATAHVDVAFVTQESFDRSLNLAKSVALTKPLRILYLGDSLTDFDRGRNYCDKVDFWLNQAFPGLASFHNAGVGGDYITRMEDRIYGRQAHRREMYDGLWNEKYDLIFIFLGHNDTKTTAKSDLKVPVVPPETQDASFRKVVAQIRQHSQAPIVFISGASMVEEICRRNHAKAIQTRPNASIFGLPEHVEAFNDVLQKLGKELGIGYLDVYTPMKNHPDKPSLFYPTDGVHLSTAGHAFVADAILKALASGIGR